MGAAPQLKPWKPGQSGNPSGRPKLPPELLAIKALTPEELRRYVSKYARMANGELNALVEARSIPVLELAIARIFQESINKGDFMRLNFLLERAIGKVEVAKTDDATAESLREIQELSDQELLKLVKEKMPSLDEPK